MAYLLGVDNGGTVSKAAVFDENGNQLAVAGIITEIITPKSGYMEKDLEKLWEANAAVIKEAITKSKINPEEIAGISFSGQGKGLYMLDENGVPVYNGILSSDMRAWKYVKKWYEDGTKNEVYKKTYQEILSGQPVSILNWFRDNKPEILKKVKYIVSVKDYIRFKITGEIYSEITDFSGSNLLNLNTGQYDGELLSLFGLEEIMPLLPPLKQSTDICGYVTKKASRETLLPKGIPVTAGMFDIDASGIASGIYNSEELAMIAGTWSINEYIGKKPISDGTVRLNSLFCIPGYYLYEESSPTSAGNLEWFITNFLSSEKEKLKSEGKKIYDLLNEWVNSIEPDESNLIYLPFLNGSNENEMAKGTFIGMTEFHRKKHMVRAIYEGVVFCHAAHLKNLLKNRKVPEKIRLSGGAANSDVWSQMFSDVLQIPVDILRGKEFGALGAAMAAGISVGIFKDFKEAVNKMVKITKTVYPREKYKDIYKEKLETYNVVNKTLNSIWDRFEVK
ncbi:MAG: FGGY-family carbohydrate kinase [Leptotrichiaceae bacterium]|nr:FGGY-family carbohydrate kinase [Leptotrichiaceae bacterium]